MVLIVSLDLNSKDLSSFSSSFPDEKKTESRAAETVNGDIARATFLAAVDSNISHFAHSLPSIRF